MDVTTRKENFQIFYSWQSDLPGNVTKNFVEACIEKAIKEINKDLEVSLFAKYTRDTEGKTGSVDIAETIYEKIADSDMFIGDISIIRRKTFWRKGKSFSNPNVLIESGYATHALEKDRVIFICNIAFGELEEMPFDIRNRKILKFNLKNKKNAEKKNEQKKLLVGLLKKEIIGVIEKGKNPSKQPKQYDVDLFKQFKQDMPHNGFIQFLIQHDIIDYHREKDLKVAFDFMYSWTGPDKEFSNAVANQLYKDFYAKLKKICVFYATNTLDLGHGMYRVAEYVLNTHGEDDKLRALYNPLADSVVKAYDDFVRYGNQNLVI